MSLLIFVHDSKVSGVSVPGETEHWLCHARGGILAASKHNYESIEATPRRVVLVKQMNDVIR